MTDRHCGECTLCCKLLPVKELEKGADTRCQHQGRKGCAIYHQLGFPGSCGLWNCAWLGGEDVPRPDRCGWVIDIVPDMVYAQNNETGEQQQILVAVVWVEPGRDPTFDPKLRRYAERCAEKNMGVMLRFGSKRAVIGLSPGAGDRREMALRPQRHDHRERQRQSLDRPAQRGTRECRKPSRRPRRGRRC